MKDTKPRKTSTMGMFDLLKGAGMLTVVLSHTAELYTLDVGGVSISSFILLIYRESLMAAFYIASGYGFRKRSIGKCIEQQLKSMAKPYLFTGLFTVLLHFVIHYKTFGYLPGTIAESRKVWGGFLLGLPHTTTYYGQTYFSCGPMWYLLALMLGWIMLDILLNVFPEDYAPWAVAATAILGWGTCLVWELPFCISQSMTIVPYIYMGHIIKKKHLFDKPLSKKSVALLLLATFIVAYGACAARSTDCISMGEWTMGPLSIFLDGIVGYFIVRLFLLWNKGSGALVRAVEAIGRRSLHIFCVHTVELESIPWYLFAAQFADEPLKGFITQFIVSMLSIWLICEVLVRYREVVLKIFPSKRKKFSLPPHYVSKH